MGSAPLPAVATADQKATGKAALNFHNQEGGVDCILCLPSMGMGYIIHAALLIRHLHCDILCSNAMRVIQTAAMNGFSGSGVACLLGYGLKSVQWVFLVPEPHA